MNNKKIKIYLYNPYPNIGGADTLIHRFMESINTKIYEIDYITLDKHNNNLSKKINQIKLNSKSTLMSFFKIMYLIKKDNHEKKIFFSMQYFVNIWSIIFIKLILNVKVFIYEINHIDEFKYSKSFFDSIKKIIIFFLVRNLYKYADTIAGNSLELSKDLSKLVNKNVKTIYNPCFIKKKINRQKYKKKGIIKILNIARFDFQKNHLTLLKAINNLKIKNKIHLTLIGYGPEKYKLSEYIEKNKLNAKILNVKKRLSNYYKNSHIFIFPSLYEGLPTTMVEAASFGIPIISSNFKSGSKEILLNGKGGYLFKKKNYKSLSSLINKFYINPNNFYNKELVCRKNIEKFSKIKNLNLFNDAIKALY